MFESLSEKLQNLFKKLRGQSRLTEENIADALREVRRALLEADVALGVTKEFIGRVKEQAIGQDALAGLAPAQQLIKIVHEELVRLLGGQIASLMVAQPPPTIILLVGLQGSGKTTTAAKLALHLRRQGRRPLLAACDIYRPAASKQLEILGKQVDVPVFVSTQDKRVLEIAQNARDLACKESYDTLIVDTAGRLHVATEMMEEVSALKALLSPHEILLVVDAMMGQDAVRTAAAFHDHLRLSGIILTKLDGDTRGGAALSVKQVTGCPIKFAAVGEKLDALEPFHPDRIATRIIGMGDILTLIEKAQQVIDPTDVKQLEQKLRKAELNLEDFLAQLSQIKKLGSMEQILGMLPIPGLSVALKKANIQEGERQFKRMEVIIGSMTPHERQHPEIIDRSRKNRIANGSGTSMQEVSKLLKDFEQMRQIMKQLSGFQKKLGKKLPKL
ncbi:MAG: signal recognition particle protein, partial [Cyanobacteria bacterium NC_groundwater_1444_Ag_S-0.65um_54_12]|nr:signal recognition particle protein [Cyanobacteria bacterium NC_groundwater_1444_Ag_S-0.65um_54_12]